MMCMMFGQLAGRESLRDLLITLQAHTNKYYHLGLGKNVSRSNLAEANEQRDYRIYESFAYELIAIARKQLIAETDFKLLIKENVYAFDSTTIDLCLDVFWWASFRTTKGAIKLHTLYDIKTSIPAFVHITEGSVHDLNTLDVLLYEPGGFYILDRGYIDYKRLYNIHQQKAFFVTRAKDNFRFIRIYSAKADKSKNIRCDQTIKLYGFYSSKDFPATLAIKQPSVCRTARTETSVNSGIDGKPRRYARQNSCAPARKRSLCSGRWSALLRKCVSPNPTSKVGSPKFAASWSSRTSRSPHTRTFLGL